MCGVCLSTSTPVQGFPSKTGTTGRKVEKYTSYLRINHKLLQGGLHAQDDAKGKDKCSSSGCTLIYLLIPVGPDT